MEINKDLNNAIWILKPLILKTFTKNGLNETEMKTMFNILCYMNIDYDIMNNYLENIIFNPDDEIDVIIEKINNIVLS